MATLPVALVEGERHLPFCRASPRPVTFVTGTVEIGHHARRADQIANRVYSPIARPSAASTGRGPNPAGGRTPARREMQPIEVIGVVRSSKEW
jgi:hypothetical protein